MARHRLAASDHLDKVALVVAFVAGAVGAWLIKDLGYGPFWAAGWTVAAMLSYVLAVTLLGRLEIEPEAIGDNCYYLGFLLTLASLATTLYQLAQGDDQVALMRSIVSGFGIALVSTILGILLRVIFIQLRPDIVARDRQTRIELQQAARNLRLELASSVATIKEFSTEAIQVASEQAARITEATNLAVEVQRGRMASDAEVYSDTLRTTLAAVGEQSARSIADSVTAASRGASEAIRDLLGEMSRAVSAFADAETAALAAREAHDSRAGAAALAQASDLSDRIEALSARLAASLAAISDDLARGVASVEAARQVHDAHAAEAAASASAAVASAATAAEAAARAETAQPKAAGGFFGWRS